jgi:hypothetical protein
MVSSLFSNVISTLALPVTPVFAILFFHDNVDGVKIISMLVAIWGFISYGWQLHEDGKAMKIQSAQSRILERLPVTLFYRASLCCYETPIQDNALYEY